MPGNGDGRRYHEANSGRDSKPVIYIFEGNNILWMILGCGLALLVFRLCHGKFNYSLGESLALALIPLSIITLYVVLLKSGKPKSFDREFFEWLAIRSRQVLDQIGLTRDRPFFAPPRQRNSIDLPASPSQPDDNDGKTH